MLTSYDRRLILRGVLLVVHIQLVTVMRMERCWQQQRHCRLLVHGEAIPVLTIRYGVIQLCQNIFFARFLMSLNIQICKLE